MNIPYTKELTTNLYIYEHTLHKRVDNNLSPYEGSQKSFLLGSVNDFNFLAIIKVSIKKTGTYIYPLNKAI